MRVGALPDSALSRGCRHERRPGGCHGGSGPRAEIPSCHGVVGPQIAGTSSATRRSTWAMEQPKRLVCVSNRISLPRRGAARGARRGPARGDAAYRRHLVRLERRDRREAPPEPEVVTHDNIRFATIDLHARAARGLLQRLLQRHALAAVPLLPRALPARAAALRRLSVRECAVRAAAAEAARAGRCRLGARLPPDSARALSAPARLHGSDRLFPAHAVSARRRCCGCCRTMRS